jgi:hypothetical protein
MRYVWLFALASCYSPDLPSCTVDCAGDGDCADGQRCVMGTCRAPGVTCDPAPTSPPAMQVELHVTVEGHGEVDVAGVGTCSDQDGGKGCTFMVIAGTQIRCEAHALDDKSFDHWTTPNCAGQTASCTLTATMATMVGAKFQ